MEKVGHHNHGLKFVYLLLLVLMTYADLTNGRREAVRRNSAGNGNGGLLPGVRARVTQKGLDYGAELAVDMLMKNKDSSAMPEFDVTVGSTTVVLSGMVIKELPRPHLEITLLPQPPSLVGRLRVEVSDLHPVVDANMTVTYKSWFLTTSRNLSVASTARNLSIMLEASLDIDSDGRPLPSNIQCNASGDMEFELTGGYSGWSSIITTMYDMLREHLKPAIFEEICGKIIRDVNKYVETDLKKVPMTAVFENDYEFDYRQVKVPYITNRFIETSHKGGIYLVARSSDPTFTVPPIPLFPQHTQKMAYVYVTDYVANTGWYSALNNGHLKFSTSDNTTAALPQLRRFLSTSCPGSSCLGSVFPQLAFLYPEAVATLDFHMMNSSRPVFRFRGRNVRVRCEGMAEIYMSTQRSQDHILTVNVTMTGNMDINIANNKVTFRINSFNLVSDIQRSSLNLLPSFAEFLFDAFMATTSRFVILPSLQELGRQGAPLDVPDVPELKFIDPVIIDHTLSGMLIVGTDVEYTVPKLNY